MVSRLRSVPYKGRRCKKVFDLDWNKMFVNKAYQTKRDIVPLFFSGENSRHFYRMANLRTRLGLKFNFEMIYLPQEMVKMENSNLTISCGHPIAWSELTPGKDAADCARAVGAYVYTINSANKPDNRQG
jgi:hypothetical protein